MSAHQDTPRSSDHIPVLLDPLLSKLAPIRGCWLDGTFGAGRYTRAFLKAGATHVYAIDRDPQVFDRARDYLAPYQDQVTLIPGTFGKLDHWVAHHDAIPLDGVVLDIGVSSMQLDQADRGFSFSQDGPLDMRMSQTGQTAADIVNKADEKTLADLFYLYGEERAARRIAARIVKTRATEPFKRTQQLSDLIAAVLPKSKPGQTHPATRSFQALRIAVNDELGELARALFAAEAVLGVGGVLAVVTFHSLEDRIVKRFIQNRANPVRPNRYTPDIPLKAPQFEKITSKAIVPTHEEIQTNPRARSAKLRLARRTAAPVGPKDTKVLGLPDFNIARVH